RRGSATWGMGGQALASALPHCEREVVSAAVLPQSGTVTVTTGPLRRDDRLHHRAAPNKERGPMSITTRAAVVRVPGQPWEITELELDPPGPNEVRVKLHAAGLCHSDDHLQKGDSPMRLPFIGGHEGAGVVEEIGPGVQRVKVGDHVVFSFIPACGKC